MAEVNPSAATTTEDWALIEQSLISSATKKNGGKLSERDLTDIKNKIEVARTRLNFTPQQVGALAQLFLKRPELAEQTAKNLIDVGKKAADTEISLQGTAQTGAIDISKLAGATDIEAQGITNKFYAGWVGPITMIGKILNACGATDWGNKCIAFAQDLAPKPISEEYAVNRLYQQKDRVGIEETKAAQSQMTVWQHALLMTNPEVVGVTPKDGAKVQGQMDAVRTENEQAPAVLPGASSVAKTAGTASTDNIVALTNELIERAKKGGSTLTQQSAEKQVAALNRADNSGNHNGNLDTTTEVAAYKKSTAYIGLPEGEKKIMDAFITDSLKQKVSAAPAANAPAPVLQ